MTQPEHSSAKSFIPEYEGGVPVFRPSYEDFVDFRMFVNKIESIGMTTGIVKVIPPEEWILELPKLPTAVVDQIEIRNPIEQNITINGGRGVFSVDNFEKRRKYSVKQWVKQCNLLSNQPPVRRGERQQVLGEYDASPGGFVSYNDSGLNPEVLNDLEQKFWKGLAYGGSPMYGADLPGSLFSDATKHWNVANLDSLLSVLPDKVPGVNDAYLYCGMWKAVFSWHLEDVDLPSINYIHFGAPKQWYSIPQAHHERFYELMSALWPEEQQKCSEFLRHKTFLVDPSFIEKQGIPVNKIVHRQQEFMITFPYGYHAGFNYGFNVAESVNFAHDSWLEIGSKAIKCECVSHSVGIDVQELIQNIKTATKNYEGDVNNKVVETDGNKFRAPKFADHRTGKCVLCPHIFKDNYVSNKALTAKAHVTCVNLIPETWIAGNMVYGLESIPKERFRLKCGYCKLSIGCCFQCSMPQCTRSYHGSCASSAGVDYHNPHKPLCYHHRKSTHTADVFSYRRAHPLLGDIVQYESDSKILSGLVSQVKKDTVELKTLPNPVTSVSVSPMDVLDIFEEQKMGPFVEPLQPMAKKRRTFSKVNRKNTAIVRTTTVQALPSETVSRGG